jgi:elongation factor 1 alpha-like protein
MKQSRSQAYDGDENDEDYYYGDDDDYDYDDDGSYFKPTPKPAAKPSGKQSSSSNKPQPKQQAHPAGPRVKSYAHDDDAEIVDSMMPVLSTALGNAHLKVSAFKEEVLVQQLRGSNYDVDMAVAKLRSIAPLDARLPEAGGGAAASAPAPKKSKTLVLGGGKKHPDGANAEHAEHAPQKDAAAAEHPAVAPTASGNSGSAGNEHGSSKDAEEQPASKAAAASASAAAAGAAAAGGKHLSKCELTSDVTVGQSGKTNLSLVVTGHVDHGKSTTIGNLLYQVGQFSDKDVQKMEQAAKRAGKATFHFAWLLDQSDEERRRGVTIDSGVHAFETEHHTVSVLDAPGHESYIENMASSSAQADLALLVVSGKPDELAVGLENGTRLHAQILKRLGVPRIVICVNKLDAVEYNEGAFREAVAKVSALLQSVGFAAGDVIGAVPISGLAGVNLVAKPDAKTAPALASWYKGGPTLVEVIDAVTPVPRMLHFPLRFVVSDVQRSGMTGRIECGTVSVGDSVLFLPANAKITVRSIEHAVVGGVRTARAGDTVEIMTSSDISAVTPGNIGCPVAPRGSAAAAFPPCHVSQSFEAVVQTYGANARAILPGYRCVLMINAVQVQATVKQLLSKMNMATGQWSPRGGMVKMIPRETQGLVLIETEFPIAFERGEECRNLGRFLIRQEGDIIGGGFIEKPVETEAKPQQLQHDKSFD